MAIVLTLVIILAIFAGIALIARRQGNRLLSEGKLRVRDLQFVDRAEVFRLREVEYPAVKEALLAADYGSSRGRIEEVEGKAALIYRTGTWRAVLRLEEEVGYEYHYAFFFVDWATRRGLPARPDTMNMVLTTVEKTMEALDPEMRMQVRQRPAQEAKMPSWL